MPSLQNQKNILILGCSFGVPNYFGPPGVAKEDHTEFLLKNKGHIVHNCSLNGGSNLETLTRAENYLNGLKIKHPAFDNQFISISNDIKIDLVIWFHTQLHRDNISNNNIQLANYIYNKFSIFFKKLNAKIAVIGGAGDIHDSFDNYITSDFLIKSWRQKILNDTTIPLSNGIGKILDNVNLPNDKKINIIDNELLLINIVKKSMHFPDGCHPGTAPHFNLVEELTKKFDL
jgi:hypothetical protein